MRVLIVNAMVPFVWGGAEELAAHLNKNIILAGHQSEILRIPSQWNPAEKLVSQMLISKGIKLNHVDRIIALKFPAYLIEHPNKVIWLLHQYRQAYDMYDSGDTNLRSEMGEKIRSLISQADSAAFDGAKRIYTNSEVTKRRLLEYNGYDAEVLMPPLNDPELFVGGLYGDYIFAGGRINKTKRQYMMIEAMRNTHQNVKLIIAGPPDTKEDRELLVDLVKKHRLQDRVQLDLRFLPRDVYANYINNALAVAYCPIDEDSVGYVSMEAATASKPIITLTDSGGILRLVVDRETGWVVHPDETAITYAMNEAYANIQTTIKYGRAANERWGSFGLTWKDTVETLIR